VRCHVTSEAEASRVGGRGHLALRRVGVEVYRSKQKVSNMRGETSSNVLLDDIVRSFQMYVKWSKRESRWSMRFELYETGNSNRRHSQIMRPP